MLYNMRWLKKTSLVDQVKLSSTKLKSRKVLNNISYTFRQIYTLVVVTGLLVSKYQPLKGMCYVVTNNGFTT